MCVPPNGQQVQHVHKSAHGLVILYRTLKVQEFAMCCLFRRVTVCMDVEFVHLQYCPAMSVSYAVYTVTCIQFQGCRVSAVCPGQWLQCNR